MADTTTQQQLWSSGARPRCRSPVGISCFPAVRFLVLCPEHALKLSLLIATSFLFLEELCLELARAIEAGDTQAASQHASALARQKAVLTIQLSEKNYADGEIG